MTEKEMDDRIDAWLDGEIDAEALASLNHWLVESPENAARFAERSHMHGHLFDWAEGRKLKSTVAGAKVSPWKILLPVAAAIAFLLGVGSWFMGPKPGEPVATLENAPGAEMKLFRRSVDLDDPVLRAGDYTLSAGLVSIRYETGVSLLIEAPAKFQLDSKQSVKLESGQIAANVPPEGVGFTIETPSAEVVDYGTEFAVEVGEDGASEIHVFQGEVEVQPRVEESEPVRLFTNAATRVEMASNVPMGIEIDESRFLRSLDEPMLKHSRFVQGLDPSLFFRMGIPKDGVTMRDKAGESDGEIIDRGARRPPFSPGKVGSSMRFDGPSQGAYLRVGDFPKPESGQLSLSCWIKAESLPRRGMIASNATSHRKGIFEAGLLRDSGKLFVGVKPEGGDDLVEVRASHPFPLHSWQHLAFVANGETLRLFLNGIEIDLAECGPVSATASHPFLGIGARVNERKQTADQFWHGRIDEFALFNHALSDADILALYQNSDP